QPTGGPAETPPGGTGPSPMPSAPPPAPGYGYGQAPAAPVPEGFVFDPVSGLSFPAGVQLANPGRRIGAYFLSFVLVIVTLVIGYIIWGLILWGRGQTPTYQVLGMRCWKPEDRRVATFGTMALREIVGRIVESLLITALISFVLMLVRRDRKCLHDLIANTVAVRDADKVLAGYLP
ncbi:MAG TPA: RDD family protein, partial [Acidimicrobiales bacterium]|nr:RDD family protein [Acidimicrobiales bacterium]